QAVDRRRIGHHDLDAVVAVRLDGVAVDRAVGHAGVFADVNVDAVVGSPTEDLLREVDLGDLDAPGAGTGCVLLEGPEGVRIVGIDNGGAVISPAVDAAAEVLEVAGCPGLQDLGSLERCGTARRGTIDGHGTGILGWSGPGKADDHGPHRVDGD